MAANFSNTLRVVKPGASACKRRPSVTGKQYAGKTEDVRLDALGVLKVLLPGAVLLIYPHRISA